MKNLKERITKLLEVYGKQTVAEINTHLHIKTSEIIGVLLDNFARSWNAEDNNEYWTLKAMKSKIIAREEDRCRCVNCAEKRDLKKLNDLLSEADPMLSPIKLFTTSRQNMWTDQKTKQIVARNIEFHNDVTTQLYEGSLDQCIKYLEANKNSQDFINGLKQKLIPGYTLPKEKEQFGGITSLGHLQAQMKEINKIARQYGILIYYRVEHGGNFKIFAEPLESKNHTERYLYAGDIRDCVKYIQNNKNNKNFFENLKWSLSRPDCFHGDTIKGCDAGGVFTHNKDMDECKECKFYRGYEQGEIPKLADEIPKYEKPIIDEILKRNNNELETVFDRIIADELNKEKKLKLLEDFLRNQTDFYFGTVIIKANLIGEMISKIRKGDRNIDSWLVKKLNDYFMDKNCFTATSGIGSNKK